MPLTNHKSRITNLLRAFASLRWSLLLLFSCISAAQETTPLPTEAANAEKGRQLIQKAITALGGDAYLKVFDMKQTGRGFGFYLNEPTGVGLGFTRYWQAPDKELSTYFKDNSWKILHVGDDGYETTFRGTRPVDKKENDDFNRRRRYSLETILRVWAQDPKTQYFYEGTTLVGPKSAHQVSLLNKDNLSATLFLDDKTFLPVQKKYQWRDVPTKTQMEEIDLYDEYRPIQGIMTPFKLTKMKQGEIISQRFVKTVEYNTGLGNALFAPPPVKYDRTKK
jgi:hypothetical protein